MLNAFCNFGIWCQDIRRWTLYWLLRVGYHNCYIPAICTRQPSQSEVVGAGATSTLVDELFGSWIASLHAGKWVTYSSSRMSFWQLMHFSDFISVLTLRFWNRRPLPMNLHPSFVPVIQTPLRSLSTKPHSFAINAFQNPKPTMIVRCPSTKFWTSSIIRCHQLILILQ